MIATTRTRSIDVLRGLVMVVMVLDHARDFVSGFRVDPTDLEETTPALFATRWITHFCAPGFVLLAGAAAHLYGRGRPPSDLRFFLLTRGLWLVVLEVTVVRFGWFPEPTYRFTLLQVIWAIGCSMVLLAPLASLPRSALAAIGIAMIALHNLLDGIALPEEGIGRVLLAVVHARGTFEPVAGHLVRVGYPLVPWVGVMALGMGVGALFERTPRERQRVLVAAGAAACVAFVALRALGGYGDPEPFAVQRDLATTVISFFNCEKYPPSLAFLLMTLGPLALALAWLDRGTLPERVAGPLTVFGRVPLFFYVAHLYLLHLPALAIAYGRWGMSAFAMPPEGHAGSPEFPLFASYAAWILALVILYPACRWYAGLKERRAREWWWLRYL